VLWLGRIVIGPFTDNLPHAGGITISLLQTIGDTWLLWVLMTRLPIALAMSLFVVSAPFDLGLSSACRSFHAGLVREHRQELLGGHRHDR